MIGVLVADDHGLVRGALAGYLELMDDLELVGQARDGEEAVALALERHPRVVVMDISRPRMDGVEATRQIMHLLPETRIVVLTGHPDRERADAALRAGAVAYVLKDREPDEISDVIRNAAATW